MKIDRHLLHKTARLARLEIKQEHEEVLARDLSKIFTWVKHLEEVDTAHLRPLVVMTTVHSVVQEDAPTLPLDHARALQNAPHKDANYFRVPQVKE